MRSILFVLVGLLSGSVAFAENLNGDELVKAYKLLGGKTLRCETAKKELAVSLSIKKVRSKYFAISMDGEGLGASPGVPDSVAVGNRLIVSYSHDEGFGVLMVDADVHYWDKDCAAGSLTVSWEPSMADEAMDPPVAVTCCRR